MTTTGNSKSLKLFWSLLENFDQQLKRGRVSHAWLFSSLLGWFLVLGSSIIKMRKFLLNHLCIYTYLCILLLLLIIDNSILNDVFRNSYCYFASSPLLHLSPSPVRAHPLVPFPCQNTCTLLFPSVLPCLLCWQWSFLTFLTSVVTLGYMLPSADLELGASN